jgi:hypothetical protein
VAIVPVIAFSVFPARFPVTERLEAVVLASVDEPDTVRLVNSPVAKARIFPKIFVTVVEASVEEPVTERFALVEVPE